ncbi:MAG TPA: phage tail tube protein [Xanthobacteraceae bacterium]|nr:phage tail tube protein [Xanthobacteraceae bacterium]
MARARGANAVLAAAFETTYGTPPASGYKKLPFVSSALGEEQNLIESDLLGLGREPLPPSKDVANNEGDVVVPVDLRNFGYWLKLLLGAPTTTGTGPYTHTFVSGALSLPSMAIEIGLPDVPSYGVNFGVRANSMTIQMQRSGLLNATMNLIARGETRSASSGAGTPSEAAIERFAQGLGEIKRNGVALGNIVSAELTYSNNLDKVEVIRADGRIEDAEPAMVGASGNVVVRFADTTLLDQAINAAACELSFGWQIDANRSLLFTLHEVFLPRPKLPVSGPGGIQATFAFQAAKDPALAKTMTVALVNDVATY